MIATPSELGNYKIADTWTRYELGECLSEENLPQDDHWDPAEQAWVQDPPF